MPLHRGRDLQVLAGRLIVFGHSFATETFNPYGGAFNWDSASESTDGSRYPELLTSWLGVDVSRRWLQFIAPPQATAVSGTYPIYVPEEGILEAVYVLPNAALTGQNTNTRQYTVYMSRNGAVSACSTYIYLAGRNQVARQSQTLLDIGQAQINSQVAYRTSVDVLSGDPVAMAATQPWPSAIFAFHSYLVFQSATVGTGLADSGATVIFRWGGNMRNLAIGGARVVRSGVYHGGWATTLLGRPPRHVYGPEVNATPGESTSATALRCDALESPIPSGWKIPMTGGVTATTTADAFAGATTIAVSALSGSVANGEQGIARSASSGSYHSLTPLGVTSVGWGRNDAVQASVERTGFKETMRFSIALACCPYFQPADRANIVYTNGSGTWTSWTPPPAGQFMVPWTSQGKACKRFTGTSTSATAVIKLPPAYDGAPVDLFFIAQAGATRGGAATITASNTFNSGTACTINTTSACVNDNLTTGLTGTVSGTTTLTLTGGSLWTGVTQVEQVGTAIKGTAGTGSIAKGTKITSISSSTVAVLDTAGTNGTVTAIETAGYVGMVKRLIGLPVGAETITISMTGMDATDSSAEFIFLGYGIESTPGTPVVVSNVAKSPADSASWTNVDNLNTDILAVIAGTATNPNSGNSTEPALPATVTYADTDTALGLGAITANFSGDGVHPNGLGHLAIANAIVKKIREVYTPDQMAAR